MKQTDTILLLDGNALLHRAWHAIPPLTTRDGLVVNAAYGFAMVVEKMLETYQPERMAVAWDVEGGTFRNEIYEDYKGHRETKEQELYDQIPLIQEILEAFGIPSIEAPGFEADDIIGTVSKTAADKGLKVLIVTGDLDSLQLVDENVHVLFFQKGISQTKRYDVEAVQERYGLTPEQLIDYKALRGDPSDNIPGVAGIGDKTATTLLKEFGTIDEVYKQIEAIPEKFAKKLRGQEDVVEQSIELVTILRDMDLEFELDDAKIEGGDEEALIQMYRDLEFRTLLRKRGEKGGREAKVLKKPETTATGQIVKSTKQMQEQFASAKQLAILIAEQPADLFGATLAALALSDGTQTFVIANPSAEIRAEIVELLKKTKRIISHDTKHLMHQLEAEFTGELFDTMIGSYILHSGTRAHDLATVAHNMLDKSIPELPDTYAKEKDYQKLATAVSMLPAIATKMKSAMKDADVLRVFEEIEMPLVPVLYKMERNGIELDVEGLATFSAALAKRITKLTTKIIELAGEEFNLNSPFQLATVLFETLELPTKGIKKTKTSYSTAASELEKLWDAHEIIPLISEYRELAKLQSTYVEALPKLVKEDGRIHTSFNQAVAATGRLSSSDPNLQNIPIKTELGREIRKAFVAPEGKKLVAADYSQIELRLAAVIANDQPFIKAFQEGADIHTRTASEVWDVPEAEVTKDQRRAAKAINFGILYGMGPRALAKSTGLSMKEAKAFIERWFEIHHAIRDYIDTTKAKAHEDGYVETLFGRKRYLPEIETGVPMLVAAAERMAINMPVQGTAADIMKLAMLRVDEWLNNSNLSATLLLQVHDELVIEADESVVEEVQKGLKEQMETVADYDVPLLVESAVAENWGEMK